MEIFSYCLSALVIISSFIPLIKNDYWTFRIFEYPRMQKLVIGILSFILLLVFASPSFYKIGFSLTLAASLGYLIYQIIPFTPLWKKQVLSATSDIPDQTLKIMISNVYEFNTNHKGCLQEIKKNDPDMVFLLETNQRWADALQELDLDFPYAIKKPLENTYGLLFFSKFPLEDSAVKFLVEDDIPSIHTKITLPSGQQVQLYGLHPTPPVPNENPRSTERDKELLLVADMAKASSLPVLVFGDLNDVAWSYTTELFLKMSQLLDPRRGRTFLNTFHAHYPMLRFPLDHVFCSIDFKLKTIKRLNNYDSDHFPVFISLQYERAAKAQQAENTLDVDQADVAEAAEKKAKI